MCRCKNCDLTLMLRPGDDLQVVQCNHCGCLHVGVNSTSARVLKRIDRLPQWAIEYARKTGDGQTLESLEHVELIMALTDDDDRAETEVD